jgi:dTDP-4-amino-4,6-dideoxygalactose transaminase
VAIFKREFAEYCGLMHGIRVGNGLKALHLIFLIYNAPSSFPSAVSCLDVFQGLII